MDKDLEVLIKRVIKDDLGQLFSTELETRFEPFLRIAKENRNGIDALKEQIREDREDINQLKIDSAKNIEQNKVIIDNQNHQEDRVVSAVEDATQKIPEQVDTAVKETLGKQSFMDKILK